MRKKKKKKKKKKKCICTSGEIDTSGKRSLA
jgi:hypothetical protein